MISTRYTLLTIILCTFIVSSQWVGLNGLAQSRFESKTLSSNIETTDLQFRLSGYSLTEVETPWGTQYKIETEGGSSIMQAGAPDLDQVFASIVIPDNALMNVEVISSSYTEIENIDIAPSKGNFTRAINPSDVSFTQSDVYAQDGFFPGKLAGLRDPYILRDFRGQTVVVYPFQYNPTTKVLRVYSDITVRVSNEGQGQKNVLQRSSVINKIDAEFKSIYEHQFVNFDNENTRFDYLVDQGNMLVICYDDFMNTMTPFVDWKNRKGIPTEMVGVSEIGSNSSSIEAYVENYYYENGLTFLLLVGDINQIPSPSVGGSASDPSYGFISGNDSYAEVIVGRFSGNNPSEIATQVERSLDYEQSPTQTSHFNNALGIASNQGPGMNGYTDDDFQDWLWATLISDTYGSYQYEYDGSGGTPQGGINSINSGVGLINYTGHGSISSWGNGAAISASQVNSLNNIGKLPFVITVGCNVGEFNSTNECFTEAWMRSENNGQPTGSIAHLGSTISQSWEPPMHGQWAMNAIITDNYDNNFTKTVGGISTNGCMHMNDAQGSSGTNETNYWTLFGDPSLNLRTDSPSNLNVNHDGMILIGQQDFIVDVGVDGALAAISRDGELLGSAYSDGGIAIIPIGSSSNVPGEVDLVVTYYNAYTYDESLMIMSPDGAYVTVSNVDINMGPDNTINQGEEIDLTIYLENLGNEDSGSIDVSLFTNDPYVNVITGLASSSGLQQNEIDLLSLSFSVLSNAPYGHQFSITMNMDSEDSNWSNTYDFSVQALTESFESTPVFSWNSSGDADWSLTSEYSNSGLYSMGSGLIEDNQESSVEVNVDVLQDGNVSFSYRVSSEYSPSGSNFYDGLTFYIDDVQVAQYQPSSSGPSPWVNVSYPVLEGNHTFKWTYSKDGGGGSTDCTNTGCDDAAFIDDIQFPTVNSDFNNVVGDINGDEIVNVLDVIQLVNMALGSQDINYSTADLNNDGIVNVLDIVMVVNLALDGRITDAKNAKLEIIDNQINILSDGLIGGVQLTLSHDSDFSFELIDNSLISNYRTTENESTIIFVLPENENLISFNGDFKITNLIVASSSGEVSVEMPSEITLSDIYPNPFNPVTNIDFYLFKSGHTSIKAYNVLGQVVDVILDQSIEHGYHSFTWDASIQPSGFYFITVQSGNSIESQKVTLLK